MDYRVLGPLEVRDGDESVPLAGAKQRALLALLLLHANRVLSRDRLIDELWGDEAPATAVQSLQVYVSGCASCSLKARSRPARRATCSRSHPTSSTCAASSDCWRRGTRRSRKATPNVPRMSCMRRSPCGAARLWPSSRSSRSREPRSAGSKTCG